MYTIVLLTLTMPILFQLPFQTHVYYLQHGLIFIVPFFLMRTGGEHRIAVSLLRNSRVALQLPWEIDD
jgi:TMEM164 family